VAVAARLIQRPANRKNGEKSDGVRIRPWKAMWRSDWAPMPSSRRAPSTPSSGSSLPGPRNGRIRPGLPPLVALTCAARSSAVADRERE
jgi:hypothetical protein